MPARNHIESVWSHESADFKCIAVHGNISSHTDLDTDTDTDRDREIGIDAYSQHGNTDQKLDKVNNNNNNDNNKNNNDSDNDKINRSKKLNLESNGSRVQKLKLRSRYTHMALYSMQTISHNSSLIVTPVRTPTKNDFSKNIRDKDKEVFSKNVLPLISVVGLNDSDKQDGLNNNINSKINGMINSNNNSNNNSDINSNNNSDINSDTNSNINSNNNSEKINSVKEEKEIRKEIETGIEKGKVDEVVRTGGTNTPVSTGGGLRDFIKSAFKGDVSSTLQPSQERFHDKVQGPSSRGG